MLFYKRTNLLDATTQTLVNTVNCVGVMGKGIAKEFKGRNPEMFESYRRICDQKALEPGKLWLWRGAPSWIPWSQVSSATVDLKAAISSAMASAGTPKNIPSEIIHPLTV